MKILVVGMGLIGGSVCKALKRKCDHTVHGCDTDEAVLNAALADGAIDGTGKWRMVYTMCVSYVSTRE